MINLYGVEIFQDTSSETVGIDHSDGEKGSSVPESFLSTPEANKLFENWHSHHSNPDAAEALLKKLNQISLRPPTLQAALLFLQYQKADDLPKEFGKKAGEPAAENKKRTRRIHNGFCKISRRNTRIFQSRSEAWCKV